VNSTIQSWRGGVRVLAFAVLATVLTACDARLPEPESPGAQLYAARCRSCHRLYAPGLLTADMWKYQLDRMQGEMARRGAPPLRPDERSTIQSYLEKHAGQ